MSNMAHKVIQSLTFTLQETQGKKYKDLGYGTFLIKSDKILCKEHDLKSKKSQNLKIENLDISHFYFTVTICDCTLEVTLWLVPLESWVLLK